MLYEVITDFSGGAVEELMHLASRMFALGIKLSAPVLALLLLTNLVITSYSIHYTKLYECLR